MIITLYSTHDFQRFSSPNSYSKTDVDATFMPLKDDYMMNGQLKSGYNVQIATKNQYVLAYDIFPNPTDTRTLIPFLDTIEKDYFELPPHIVADAGYGSELNYHDILVNRKREAWITYLMYQKSTRQTHGIKRTGDMLKKKMSTHGQTTSDSHTYDYTRTGSHGFQSNFKAYECENCSNCPLRLLCTKAKGKNRQ